jgi:hypothetical protein
MASTQDDAISVCGVGKYRTTAEAVAPLLHGTPFRFTAMLDTVTAEPYNFTQDRLGLVLRSLYPFPRCFIAGEAVEEHVNKAAIEVWHEFVKEKQIENPLLINVCPQCEPCGKMC